uniref:Major facilitator superfamily (MFS) profile domain-containing protein n=1 Tax=Panagrolaimus superbus TaxID=310955 RepID=A0A914YT05_9BILA
MGLGEDFISPAQTSFINRWYSPTEMARIGAFTITGKALAGTVGFPVSSYLCQLQEIDGWRLMFYTFAILGGIWIIIWGIYATSSPSKHRCISSEEKEYILEELKQLEMNHDPDDPKLYKGSIPWKSILTSKAVIINLICQFTFNFSEAILSAYLPTYIDQVLKLDLNQNGYFAMISFFAQLIFQILFGIFTDMIHKKDVISGTTSCKLCQGLENFLCALSYLGLGFLANKDHLFLAGMFLVFNGIGTAASVGGFMTAQPSLAPQYAGIISSILRTTAALGALSSINVVGFINKEGTPIQWRTIWIIAASLNVVTGIIFLIGGEAETQEWAKNDETENDKTLSSRKSSTEHPLTNE